MFEHMSPGDATERLFERYGDDVYRYAMFVQLSVLSQIKLPSERRAAIIRQTQTEAARQNRPCFRGIGSRLQSTAAVAVVVLAVAGAFVPVHGERLWQKFTGAQGAQPVSITPNHVVTASIEQLLHKYGWTEAGTGSASTVRLPTSFDDVPSGYPLGLYWNYHNVLSKDIGLDITPYLGQPVTVHMVPLKQIWGDPNPTDAIVIDRDGRIIAAWSRNGFNDGGSLKRHYFGDLVKMSWGDWLTKQGYVAIERQHNVISNSASPVQVIHKFLDAVNHHDVAVAYQLMSYDAQFNLMTPNADRLSRQLYLTGWNSDQYGLSNVVYWRLKTIRPYRWYLSSPDVTANWYRMMPVQFYRHQGYTVLFTAKYKKVTVQPNGPGGYEFNLVRDTANSPWRIDGFGTGG